MCKAQYIFFIKKIAGYGGLIAAAVFFRGNVHDLGIIYKQGAEISVSKEFLALRPDRIVYVDNSVFTDNNNEE